MRPLLVVLALSAAGCTVLYKNKVDKYTFGDASVDADTDSGPADGGADRAVLDAGVDSAADAGVPIDAGTDSAAPPDACSSENPTTASTGPVSDDGVVCDASGILLPEDGAATGLARAPPQTDPVAVADRNATACIVADFGSTRIGNAVARIRSANTACGDGCDCATCTPMCSEGRYALLFHSTDGDSWTYVTRWSLGADYALYEEPISTPYSHLMVCRTIHNVNHANVLVDWIGRACP